MGLGNKTYNENVEIYPNKDSQENDLFVLSFKLASNLEVNMEKKKMQGQKEVLACHFLQMQIGRE